MKAFEVGSSAQKPPVHSTSLTQKTYEIHIFSTISHWLLRGRVFPLTPTCGLLFPSYPECLHIYSKGQQCFVYLC